MSKTKNEYSSKQNWEETMGGGWERRRERERREGRKEGRKEVRKRSKKLWSKAKRSSNPAHDRKSRLPAAEQPVADLSGR
jgi:hypothetical protein